MKNILLICLTCIALISHSLILCAKKSATDSLIIDDSTGLSVPPGFEADLVYKVDKEKYGSWISMSFDPRGRLVVSDQYKAGTFLINLPTVGQTLSESSITKLSLESGQW